MNKKEVARMFVFLKGAYPWCLNNMQDEEVINMLDVWLMYFKEYENEKVIKAVKKTVKENKSSFFPSIGMIVSNIEE